MEIRGKWRKEEEGGRRKGEGREGRRKRENINVILIRNMVIWLYINSYIHMLKMVMGAEVFPPISA